MEKVCSRQERLTVWLAVSKWEFGLDLIPRAFGKKCIYPCGMLKSVSLFCAIFIGMIGTPAVACRSSNDNYWVTVVRSQLPAKLPADAFVADIQVEHPDSQWSELATGVRAHVTRLVQGTFTGVDVIVRGQTLPNQFIMTSCGSYSFGGPAGYVIGTPLGYENGVLVIQPTFEQTAPRSALFYIKTSPLTIVVPTIRLRPMPRRSTCASPRCRRAR